MAIANPDNPYRSLEVRGQDVAIAPDESDAALNAISITHTGAPFDPAREPFARFVATVEVERHAFHKPDDAPETTL
jgi:hypothetical protein